MKLKLYFHVVAILVVFIHLPSFAADSINCVRAKPTPIFETVSTLKNYSFSSTYEREAKESFTLPSGVSVNIIHNGCENFALELHFLINSEGQSSSNVTFWLQKVSALLAELKSCGKTNHINSIQKGISQAIKTEGYKYKEPIETIEGYEYNYFQVVPVSSTKFELIVTYVVAL